jgi:hypothetical protein
MALSSTVSNSCTELSPCYWIKLDVLMHHKYFADIQIGEVSRDRDSEDYYRRAQPSYPAIGKSKSILSFSTRVSAAC